MLIFIMRFIIESTGMKIVKKKAGCKKPVNTTGQIKDKNTSRYERKKIERPTIIKYYNRGMGGTDLFDQRLSYYRPNVKTASCVFPLTQLCCCERLHFVQNSTYTQKSRSFEKST